ncbi:hypothetical protein [Inquilinus limosus]|uniref:hypothetical protein n=1 Tax=Inquilinus limosus TaxID=171674 RepID=UPI0012DEF794|nr:hypothetical protein [Inquilinus limosus]
MRLSDVSSGTAIVALCGRCKTRRELDRRKLVEAFGPTARLIKLELILKCRRCRTRAASRIQLCMLPR